MVAAGAAATADPGWMSRVRQQDIKVSSQKRLRQCCSTPSRGLALNRILGLMLMRTVKLERPEGVGANVRSDPFGVNGLRAQ
jgi:hypothetical protein